MTQPFSDFFGAPYAAESEIHRVGDLLEEVFCCRSPFSHVEFDSVSLGDWLEFVCEARQLDFVIVEEWVPGEHSV